MAKTIHGVPESLTREQFTALIRSFGFTPESISELRIDPTGVHVTAFEFNEDGTRFIGPDGSAYAKHTIHIPVID